MITYDIKNLCYGDIQWLCLERKDDSFILKHKNVMNDVFHGSAMFIVIAIVICSYLGGLTFLMYKLPFVECLMFGALISATDPVTVLSIFQVSMLSFLFMSFILHGSMVMLPVSLDHFV